MNFYTFFLFFIDKRKAEKNKYRISEKQLLLSSFIVGGMGSLIGMAKFRHKTQKIVFKIAIPIASILTIATFLVVLFWM